MAGVLDPIFRAAARLQWDEVEALCECPRREAAYAQAAYVAREAPPPSRSTLASRLRGNVRGPAADAAVQRRAPAKQTRRLRPVSTPAPLRGAAAARDELGRTALHVAAHAHAPAAAIEALLAVQPGAAAARDGRSQTPLHLAAAGGADYTRPARAAARSTAADAAEAKRARDVVRLLVSAAPECAAAVDGSGRTPVEIAVSNRRWAIVEALAAAAPSAVGRADLSRGGPLYADAKANSAPQRVLDALLDAHPQHNMRLPTLLQCGFYDEALAATTREACAEADEAGQLPLHVVAGDAAAPRALVQALIDAYPAAVIAEDFSGRRPLHYAVTAGGPAKLYRAPAEPKAALR